MGVILSDFVCRCGNRRLRDLRGGSLDVSFFRLCYFSGVGITAERSRDPQSLNLASDQHRRRCAVDGGERRTGNRSKRPSGLVDCICGNCRLTYQVEELTRRVHR